MKQALHRVIEIDPAKFADPVPTENGTGTTEYLFDEADVLKFLIDQMNDARISISMINHDHEIAIEYRGRREYFSMGLSSLDAPAGAVIDGMETLSCILNDYEDTESWTAYRNGKHALHILRKPDMEMERIPSSDTTTPDEIPEAEDNIESTMEGENDE